MPTHAYGVTEGWHAPNASNLTPHCVPKTQRGAAVRQVERCNVADKQYKRMTYMRDLERKLKALLKEGDEARIMRFVKEKALESYHNGLDAVSLRVGQATQKLERSVRAS
jgi:dTDP-4-dehydrorhamnose reductase